MQNVLSGLGVESPSTQPAAPVATEAAAPEGNTPAMERPLLVLRAIANGQLPGVTVPKGTPGISSNLSAQDITDAGVGIYRPHDEALVAVLFNAEKVTLPEVQEMDKAGSLADSFPAITSFLGTPAPSAAGPLDGLTPEVAPEVTPEHVPTLPARGDTGAAMIRMKQLTGTEPSKRPIPGGGSVLNGLLQRPI